MSDGEAGSAVCAVPGCQRNAKAGYQLCGRHLASRAVGVRRHVEQRNAESAAVIRSLRPVIIEELRQVVRDADAKFADPAERWDYLKQHYFGSCSDGVH